MKILHTHESIFEVATGINIAVCVTTNGIVKADGKAVMGAGVAKECADLFPEIPLLLGDRINKFGNRVHKLGLYNRFTKYGMVVYQILSFPTKYHWRYNSDINLIIKSCTELVEIADLYEYSSVYLTPPGCGNGHLDWETQVKPNIEHILDDRFIVVIKDS